MKYQNKGDEMKEELDFDDSFDQMMDLAIKVNARAREMLPFAKKGISPIQWCADFCTISIDPGRATGKTSYIRRHAIETDIVIVKNMLMLRQTQPFVPCKVFIENEIPKRLYGLDLSKTEIVYIDEAHYYADRLWISSLYKFFIPRDTDALFIRMG